MKEEHQKPLKKSTLLFLPNPVPFNGQSYQKQKGPGTSAKSLFRLRSKFRKIPLLVIPYLTKFDIKRLLSYFKNCILKFMQTSSWHHKLFHFHLSFFIWRVWKEWGKLQKFEYLEKEKSFFDEIKDTFHSFGKAIIWWKNKNLIKNSGHKL